MKRKLSLLLFALLIVGLVLMISSCVSRKTEEGITLLLPENNKQMWDLNVTLEWKACQADDVQLDPESEYVEYYRVYLAMADQWYREPFLVYPDASQTSSNEATETVVTFTTPDLSKVTDYKWRIEAVFGDGRIKKSPEWYFTSGFKLQSAPGTEEMAKVKPGTFEMGNEGGLYAQPVHTVTLTYAYLIGQYEVTFRQYDSYCEATGAEKPYDNGFGRGERPVINVHWFEAIDYCNWLSEREGLPKAYNDNYQLIDPQGNKTTDIKEVVGFRLPTEAEWEYAARGGHKLSYFDYAGSNDIDAVAWYVENSGDKTQFVGDKAPNALSLYDMTGNVQEFVTDYGSDFPDEHVYDPVVTEYHDNRGGLVVKGGCFRHGIYYTQLGRRMLFSARSRFYNGFRIARTFYKDDYLAANH